MTFRSTGGEEYQVVMLDQPIDHSDRSAPTLCEPSQTPVLDFDPPLPGEFGGRRERWR